MRCGFFGALLLLAATVATGEAAELRIAAAASLADSVAGCCAAFVATRPGVQCVVSRGGSGLLVRQIEQGAPVDLVVVAGTDWSDYLTRHNLVAPGTVAPLVRNRLVFVGTPGAARSLADLGGLRRIALGNPTTVPAGSYAAEALRRCGRFEALQAEGKLVYTQDVRQALVYAERGEADGAFVYRSDAQLATRVVVLFDVPQELYPPAVATMALTVAGGDNATARDFSRYLLGAESTAAFLAAGFERP